MERKSMVRAISLLGLSALFLLTSPALRKDVLGVIAKAASTMQFHAPFSYIAGVILVLVSLVVSFNRGSRAR
jgi:hypothetical protein